MTLQHPYRVANSIKKGLDWVEENLTGLLPDAAFTIYAGLLLVDKYAAEQFRSAYYQRAVCKITLPLDYLMIASKLFDIFRRTPRALAAPDMSIFEDTVKRRKVIKENDLYRVDRVASNRAICGAALKCLDKKTLTWMRNRTAVGYELTHQLLAWIVCVKNSYFVKEAERQVVTASFRLYAELSSRPPSYYDLYAESVAFLCMAGLSKVLNASHYTPIVAAQRSDGSWEFFYTNNKDHQKGIQDRLSSEESPLISPVSVIDNSLKGEARRRYLRNLYLGHSTALSIYCLLSLLKEHIGKGHASRFILGRQPSWINSHREAVWQTSKLR